MIRKSSTKYIAMFSGGKDSTRMVLELIRRDYPLDYILFADLGAEWPQMYQHIDMVENRIGRGVMRLKHPKGDFWYWFGCHVLTKGKRIGQRGYGWCGKQRWGTAAKRESIKRFTRQLQEQGIDIIEYHGISLGEESRLGKNNDGRKILYPLVEWGMTETENLHACYDAGFPWDGLYEHLDRVSCWCCENKNLKELRMMYHFYPETWQQLEKLQSQTPFLFKGKGVQCYTQRFQREEQQDLFCSVYKKTLKRIH